MATRASGSQPSVSSICDDRRGPARGPSAYTARMRSRMITSPGWGPDDNRQRGIAAATLLVLTVCLLAGCHETLFPVDTPRTQFEAYDRMRNQAAPEKEMDALGRPQPALRARLAPK